MSKFGQSGLALRDSKLPNTNPFGFASCVHIFRKNSSSFPRANPHTLLLLPILHEEAVLEGRERGVGLEVGPQHIARKLRRVAELPHGLVDRRRERIQGPAG